MSEKNWRTEVDAIDYFGHQKKSTTLADRRPVIRKSSDLSGMGPAMNGTAFMVTDWSDPIATYNGYYSSSRAANGPRLEIAGDDTGYDTHEYTGFVVSDSLLGGTQVITDLETGSEYSRTFQRAPTDPAALTWSVWSARHRIPPTAFALAPNTVNIEDGIPSALLAPDLDGVNIDGTYASAGAVVSILEQGIYSGVIGVNRDFVGGDPASAVDVFLGVPLLGSTSVVKMSVRGNTSSGEVLLPFTFINTKTSPADLTVALTQYTGLSQDANWSRLDITRTGDAI